MSRFDRRLDELRINMQSACRIRGMGHNASADMAQRFRDIAERWHASTPWRQGTVLEIASQVVRFVAGTDMDPCRVWPVVLRIDWSVRTEAALLGRDGIEFVFAVLYGLSNSRGAMEFVVPQLAERRERVEASI